MDNIKYNKFAIASVIFYLLSVVLLGVVFIISAYVPLYDGLLGILLEEDNFGMLSVAFFFLSIYAALQGLYLIVWQRSGRGRAICLTMLVLDIVTFLFTIIMIIRNMDYLNFY